MVHGSKRHRRFNLTQKAEVTCALDEIVCVCVGMITMSPTDVEREITAINVQEKKALLSTLHISICFLWSLGRLSR